MPLAGFEPTIPVFKRAKTFHHALGRAATVTGQPKKILIHKPVAAGVLSVPHRKYITSPLQSPTG
jgi:hypothetical protein